MNKDEILDDSIFEDINDDILSENLEQDSSADIIDSEALNAGLEMDISGNSNDEVESSEEIILEDFVDDSVETSESIIVPDSETDISLDNSSEEIETKIDDKIEEEEIINTNDLPEEIVEQKLEVVELDITEHFITDDLENSKIEFGIEAKGFILSVKMMEAMIDKGYIFKDILQDKLFDAVMIFNGDLGNTVMTSDLKIRIEDDKIQLIKG